MRTFHLATALSILLSVPAFASDAHDVTPEQLRALASGTNELAVDLYKKLSEGEARKNLLFSPFSIQSALSMAYAGARGETAQQMASTLHLNAATGDVHAAFSELLKTYAPVTGQAYQLDVANRLWGQTGFDFLPSYLELTRKYYGAELAPLDLAGNPEGSRTTINDWVAERTRDKIKDLLSPGFLTPSSRLVLTNAVYFKGRWERVFDAQNTHRDGFFVAGRWQNVNMMNQTASFAYAARNGVQILEMPYEGGRIAMDVILPGVGQNLASLAQTLTRAQLDRWLGMLETQRVKVSLPQWKLDSAPPLTDPLRALGLSLAFNRQADFSGIDGRRDLFISQLAHKVFIEVNENGTEAAAATAGGVVTTGPMPMEPRFIANRPFLYLIRDRMTGAILFLGRLDDPTAT